MNCKPHQLAWIRVPAFYNGTGIDALHNHVVQTKDLLPGYSEPTWVVSPPQSVVFSIKAIDGHGRPVHKGDRAVADGIPDAWLQPFDPKAAPEDETTVRELELTS